MNHSTVLYEPTGVVDQLRYMPTFSGEAAVGVGDMVWCPDRAADDMREHEMRVDRQNIGCGRRARFECVWQEHR